jgi:hypothetical protein
VRPVRHLATVAAARFRFTASIGDSGVGESASMNLKLMSLLIPGLRYSSHPAAMPEATRLTVEQSAGGLEPPQAPGSTRLALGRLAAT